MKWILVVAALCVSPGTYSQTAKPAAPPPVPKNDCVANPVAPGCPGFDEVVRRNQGDKFGWFPVGSGQIKAAKGPEQAAPAPPPEETAPPPVPAAPPEIDWRVPISARPLPLDWPRWQFAPPDAGVVLGVKLRTFLNSPVFRQAAGGSSSVPAIDELWMSVRQPGDDPVFLLVGSNLLPVATGLRGKGLTVCFVDSRSLLAGEWNAVNRSLQRILGPDAASIPPDPRARQLWQNDDLWIAASRASAKEVVAFSGDVPADISRVSLGLKLGDRPALDVLLHVPRPAEAGRLASRYRQNPAELGLPAGQTAIEAVSQGVSAHAPADNGRLQNTARYVIDRLFPVLEAAHAASPRPAANAVVIEGLDDGPHRIPTAQK